jgi:hypothetical protein
MLGHDRCQCPGVQAAISNNVAFDGLKVLGCDA